MLGMRNKLEEATEIHGGQKKHTFFSLLINILKMNYVSCN